MKTIDGYAEQQLKPQIYIYIYIYFWDFAAYLRKTLRCSI